MRENRMYGSEGGEPGNRASLPLSFRSTPITIDEGSAQFQVSPAPGCEPDHSGRKFG